MPYEMTVALSVADQAAYGQYRAEMTPLLEARGGKFRYDFEVARELKPGEDPPINRVFVISFPDQATKEAFFSDPAYLEIRGRLFVKAVARTVRIGEGVVANTA